MRKTSLAAELFSKGTDVDCDLIRLKQQRRSESWSRFSENTLFPVLGSFQKFLFQTKILFKCHHAEEVLEMDPSSCLLVLVQRSHSFSVHANCQTGLDTDEWSAWRSEQQKVGVRSICGIPGDGVGTPMAGLSFSSSLPVNPH